MIDEQRMTVVFTRKTLGPCLIKTSARTWVGAIENAADECVDFDDHGLDEQDFVEAPEEIEFELDLAKLRFLEDEVTSIKVYAGWPVGDYLDEEDDVIGLELIHEE